MIFEIGKTYLVPYVEVKEEDGTLLRLPVLHTHIGDISGEKHHHVDYRFLSSETMQILSKNYQIGEILAVRGEIEIKYGEFLCTNKPVPITIYNDKAKPEFIKLQNLASKKKLRLNISTMICPHQNCHIDTDPIEVCGKMCYVCPCHGLAWSCKDGRLIRKVSIT